MRNMTIVFAVFVFALVFTICSSQIAEGQVIGRPQQPGDIGQVMAKVSKQPKTHYRIFDSAKPPSYSDTGKGCKKSKIQVQDLIHQIFFANQNINSLNEIQTILSQFDTGDQCDGQNTFFNWDVIPLEYRFLILKRVDPSIDLENSPTNWLSLSNDTQQALNTTLAQYLPVNLNSCLSVSLLQNALCNQLGSFLTQKIQAQVSFVASQANRRPKVDPNPFFAPQAMPAADIWA